MSVPALASVQSARGRRVGTTLKDKWRLDAVVGVGGMAEVYAGTHRNGKKVAVKVLLPQLAVDPELCRRFVQEGYIANHVDHPGVVAVHDDDLTEDGAPFLVMDLLEGECISDTVGRGRMPVAEAVRVAHAILETLGAAHAKGVLHRDVKPGNVFNTQVGVKLLDFGIARMETADVRTMTGATMGTPAYMPPEQARGLMREVDARSDVWAAGATLFCMLTGGNVRRAETTNELLALAMTQPVASIVETAPWLSPALVALVDKSLAFEKSDRFQSAREMAAALAALSPDDLREPSDVQASTVVQTIAQSSAPRGCGAPQPALQPAAAPSWTHIRNRRQGMAPRSNVPVFVAGGALVLIAALIVGILFGFRPSRPVVAATDTVAAPTAVAATAPAAAASTTMPAASIAPEPASSAEAASRAKKLVKPPAPPAAPPAKVSADPFDRRL